ncbi:MAG: hypothetical protein ABR564_05105, partial [Candidatus Dormibacteria bacterium]
MTPPARIRPSSSITEVHDIGPQHARRLERLGVHTVRDLLFHLPRRYEDTRDVLPLAALRPGDVQTV